jgi:hypothetical protein
MTKGYPNNTQRDRQITALTHPSGLKPEALDHGDFDSSAAGLAGADQDRRQQARRVVSVADQDVVGGKSGIK